jgi:hypothetical protein
MYNIEKKSVYHTVNTSNDKTFGKHFTFSTANGFYASSDSNEMKFNSVNIPKRTYLPFVTLWLLQW